MTTATTHHTRMALRRAHQSHTRFDDAEISESFLGRLPSDTRSTLRQTMLVLGTEVDAPPDWLRAGEALERVLLEIARYGYAAGPLMQALEVPETKAELSRALGLTFHPQFLLRVGRVTPVMATPRRDLDDLLDEPRS